MRRLIIMRRLLLALGIFLGVDLTAHAQYFEAPVANPNAFNSWSGQQVMGASGADGCPLPAGATIAISASSCAAGAGYGVIVQNVTLNQNSVLSFPTGLNANSAQQWELIVKQGSTCSLTAPTNCYGLSFANGAGYNTPAPAQTAGGGAELNLCTEPSCEDVITFLSSGNSYVRASNNGASGFLPVKTPTLDSNHVVGGTCSGNPSVCTLAITGSTAGHFRTVGYNACINGGCTPAIGAQAVTISDGTNTCTPSPNAFYNGNGGSGVELDWWSCPIASSGNYTISVTFPSGFTPNFFGMFIEEWAPLPQNVDAGLAQTGTNSGTSASIATLGAASAGNLVLAAFNASGASAACSTGTKIDEDGGNHNIVCYSVASTATPQTLAITAVSGNNDSSLAAFK